MNFIKKNIILCLALGATLVSSVVLMVYIFVGHGHMTQSLHKIEEIKSEIKKVQRQKPKPHKTNLIRIQKDASEYQVKIDQLYSFFGQPYRDAYNSYVNALGKDMTNEKFIVLFEEFWNKNAIRGSNQRILFDRFNIQNFAPFDLSKAKDIFKNIYKDQTIETIDEGNINEIIMHAIGVPRRMSPLQCKMVLSSIQENLLELIKSNQIYTGTAVATFTFGNYLGTTTLPPEEDIPSIIEQLTIIGDIFKRIAQSGIKNVENIERGALHGIEEGKFRTYSYTFTLIGKMDELRAFVNLLSEAYTSKRVYVVRNISFVKMQDQAQELLTEGHSFKSPVAVTAKAEQEVAPPRPGAKLTEAQIAAERAKAEAKRPYYERETYAETLIGESKDVRMEISFDYIEYIRKQYKIQE
ncbi:MAG: hypothetical protein JXR78_07785 [Victivallales bacterium]|nr:hypothetical protein [Victivallales bacterium]